MTLYLCPLVDLGIIVPSFNFIKLSQMAKWFKDSCKETAKLKQIRKWAELTLSQAAYTFTSHDIVPAININEKNILMSIKIKFYLI